ncbi:MAG: lysozyme family protein [Caulobacteraceae bacterium]|nr:lysozyme family protein [Caulobacteraceae bacterium]
MTPRHRVSRAAIELLKRFEGYRQRAAELPDGRWTIGHGHTLTAREGAEVSESDAEALLLYDLVAVAHAVNEAVFAPLTQNQFDALCSFVFNIGLDNFRQSAVLRRLNEGQHLQAACAMEMWRQAEFGGERIVVDALVRRRSAEKTLFLTPRNGAWLPAPSPILRPLVDAEARRLVPDQTPAPLVAALEGERLVLIREDADQLAPPADVELNPVAAAAEAVQARLEVLFQDPGDEPASEVVATAPEPPSDFAPFSAAFDTAPASAPRSSLMGAGRSVMAIR